MPVSIDKIIAELPKDSQKRIAEQANELIQEYESLQEFRKDIGLTQSELADALSTSQVNISKLESRKDIHLSTLRKYVEALGCQLEILITTPEKRSISLKKL